MSVVLTWHPDIYYGIDNSLPPANEVWGEVIFSEASVIGVSPLWTETPLERDLRDRHPLEGHLVTATEGSGTHPIGMYTCLKRDFCDNLLGYILNYWNQMLFINFEREQLCHESPAFLLKYICISVAASMHSVGQGTRGRGLSRIKQFNCRCTWINRK